jgi:hypothetical protein
VEANGDGVGRGEEDNTYGEGCGDATAKGAGRPGKIAMDPPEAGEMRRGRSEVRALWKLRSVM